MENEIKAIMEFTDKLLDIVDNANEFTRSDLQGAIQAQVMQILAVGKSLGAWNNK